MIKDESQTSQKVKSGIEAILFVSGNPVQIAHLAELFNLPIKELEKYLQTLEQDLLDGRGIRLLRHAGRIQLTSSPEHAELIENYLGLESSSKLSRAALETLAIIAYRQPITRPAIDTIRGVNSDAVLKSLLSKGLIEELGRTDGPGRPIIYGVTSEFLQHFGLPSIHELPELFEDEEDLKARELLKD